MPTPMPPLDEQLSTLTHVISGGPESTSAAALHSLRRDLERAYAERDPKTSIRTDTHVVGVLTPDLPGLVEALLSEGDTLDTLDTLIRVRITHIGAVVFLAPRAVRILADRRASQHWHLRGDRLHTYPGRDAYPVW